MSKLYRQSHTSITMRELRMRGLVFRNFPLSPMHSLLDSPKIIFPQNSDIFETWRSNPIRRIKGHEGRPTLSPIHRGIGISLDTQARLSPLEGLAFKVRSRICNYLFTGQPIFSQLGPFQHLPSLLH